MSLSSRFKALPVAARRQLSIGIVAALVLALPLFVGAITSQKFLINQNAQENPPTNACGGTCGSIYNCNVNLFCYQGFCRNPDCPNDITCGCTATPTPTIASTIKPTAKPTLAPTPTPEIIYLTPAPTATATPEITILPTPVVTAPPQNIPGFSVAGIFIGIDIIGVVVILILLRRKK